jgi:signal peptidase I
MSNPDFRTPARTHESPIRRAAHAVLVAAVRGRRGRGGDWGEAVLAEFGETTGNLEAVRWALGGLRAAWQERRGRVSRLPRRERLARRAVATLVVAVIASLVVNQWFLTVRGVNTGSMETSLLVGDRYLVDKVGFRVTGLHRGDIVEQSTPTGTRVKRVIGLPGDTISCVGGQVLIDGSHLDEPYLRTDYPDEVVTDCTTVTVPPDHLYLLGDHRIVSQDSRQSGPVREDSVDGRMLVKVWPLHTGLSGSASRG